MSPIAIQRRSLQNFATTPVFLDQDYASHTLEVWVQYKVYSQFYNYLFLANYRNG